MAQATQVAFVLAAERFSATARVAWVHASRNISADFDFQVRLLLFVRPTVGGLYPLRSQNNPAQFARGKHMVDLYKNFVRPFMRQSRFYHHTPVFNSEEPQGWGVLELAARDHTRAMAGVFQLSAPHEPEYHFRPRGLDISKRYKVTWDNSGQTCEVDGFTLVQQGVTVRREGALTSELLLFEAL